MTGIFNTDFRGIAQKFACDLTNDPAHPYIGILEGRVVGVLMVSVANLATVVLTVIAVSGKIIGGALADIPVAIACHFDPDQKPTNFYGRGWRQLETLPYLIVVAVVSPILNAVSPNVCIKVFPIAKAKEAEKPAPSAVEAPPPAPLPPPPPPPNAPQPPPMPKKTTKSSSAGMNNSGNQSQLGLNTSGVDSKFRALSRGGGGSHPISSESIKEGIKKFLEKSRKKNSSARNTSSASSLLTTPLRMIASAAKRILTPLLDIGKSSQVLNPLDHLEIPIEALLKNAEDYFANLTINNTTELLIEFQAVLQANITHARHIIGNKDLIQDVERRFMEGRRRELGEEIRAFSKLVEEHCKENPDAVADYKHSFPRTTTEIYNTIKQLYKCLVLLDLYKETGSSSPATGTPLRAMVQSAFRNILPSGIQPPPGSGHRQSAKRALFRLEQDK